MACPIVAKAWVLSPGVSLRMNLAAEPATRAGGGRRARLARVARIWARASRLRGPQRQPRARRLFGPLEAWSPDVIVLDVMLPGRDGFTLLPEIRRLTTAPVVMLTARTEIAEKLAGFSAGADDYVGKPFDLEELVARLRTLLRRPRIEEHETLHLRRSEHRHAEPHRLSRQSPDRALGARVRSAPRLRRTRRRSADALAAARSRLGHRSRRDPEHRRDVRFVPARETRQRRTRQTHPDAARRRLRAAGDADVTSPLDAAHSNARRDRNFARARGACSLAGALLAFGFYIRTLSNELSGTLAQLEAALTHTPLPDARAGGKLRRIAAAGNGQRDRLPRCKHTGHRLPHAPFRRRGRS